VKDVLDDDLDGDSVVDGDLVQGLVAAVTLPQPSIDPFLASKTEIVFPRTSFSSPPRVRSLLLLRILRET